ncbi:MAG: SAM-dependent methyltransferase, partial [Candidatus Omnitrophota bacterium]
MDEKMIFDSEEEMLVFLGGISKGAEIEFGGYYYEDDQGKWHLGKKLGAKNSVSAGRYSDADGVWHTHPDIGASGMGIPEYMPTPNDLLHAYDSPEELIVTKPGSIVRIAKNIAPETEPFATLFREASDKIDIIVKREGFAGGSAAHNLLLSELLNHVIQKFIIERLPRDMLMFDFGDGAVFYNYNVNSWETIANILGFDVEQMYFSYNEDGSVKEIRSSVSASKDVFTISPISGLLEMGDDLLTEFRRDADGILEARMDDIYIGRDRGYYWLTTPEEPLKVHRMYNSRHSPSLLVVLAGISGLFTGLYWLMGGMVIDPSMVPLAGLALIFSAWAAIEVMATIVYKITYISLEGIEKEEEILEETVREIAPDAPEGIARVAEEGELAWYERARTDGNTIIIHPAYITDKRVIAHELAHWLNDPVRAPSSSFGRIWYRTFGFVHREIRARIQGTADVLQYFISKHIIDPLEKAIIKARSPVARRLREEIEEKGRITFAEFMDISLYSEEGYYTRRAKIGPGPADDFATHPELFTPHFGKALAKQIFEMWEHMGRPARFQVVEMGAGNGVMAHDILEELSGTELSDALEYIILESSPSLIEKQRRLLSDKGWRVKWIRGSALDMPLSGIEGVFISNELPDALPVHRVKFIDGQLREAYVTTDENGNLREVWDEVSSDEITEYVDRFIGLRAQTTGDADSIRQRLTENELAVNLNAIKWQKALHAALSKGYVMTFDYGFYTPYDIVEDEVAVSIMGKSEAHNDMYDYPGRVDITSGVDFRTVLDVGEEIGFDLERVVLEEEFFRGIGGTKIFDFMRDHMRSEEEDKDFFTMIQSKGIKKSALAGRLPKADTEPVRTPVPATPKRKRWPSIISHTSDVHPDVKEILPARPRRYSGHSVGPLLAPRDPKRVFGEEEIEIIAGMPGQKRVMVADDDAMTYLSGDILTHIMASAQFKYTFGLATGGTTEALRKLLGLSDMLSNIYGKSIDIEKILRICTLDNYYFENYLKEMGFSEEEANKIIEISSYESEQMYMMIENLMKGDVKPGFFIAPPGRTELDWFSSAAQFRSLLLKYFCVAECAQLWQLHGIGTNSHDAFNEVYRRVERELKDKVDKIMIEFYKSGELKRALLADGTDLAKYGLERIPPFSKISQQFSSMGMMRDDHPSLISFIIRVQNAGHLVRIVDPVTGKIRNGFHPFFLKFMGDNSIYDVDEQVTAILCSTEEQLLNYTDNPKYHFRDMQHFVDELIVLFDKYTNVPAESTTQGTKAILDRGGIRLPDGRYTLQLVMASAAHKQLAVKRALESPSDWSTSSIILHMAKSALLVATEESLAMVEDIETRNTFFTFEAQGTRTKEAADKKIEE